MRSFVTAPKPGASGALRSACWTRKRRASPFSQPLPSVSDLRGYCGIPSWVYLCFPDPQANWRRCRCSPKNHPADVQGLQHRPLFRRHLCFFTSGEAVSLLHSPPAGQSQRYPPPCTAGRKTPPRASSSDVGQASAVPPLLEAALMKGGCYQAVLTRAGRFPPVSSADVDAPGSG